VCYNYNSSSVHYCAVVYILCVAVLQYCSVLQCVALCCSVLQCGTMYCSVLQCVAVCCSVLQCVAVRCSVSQCVAVCCNYDTSDAQYCAVGAQASALPRAMIPKTPRMCVFVCVRGEREVVCARMNIGARMNIYHAYIYIYIYMYW